MKVQGTYSMKAPRQAVWDRLIDPNSIAGCLPGVEKLEPLGNDAYAMAMHVGVGPVKGTYDGKVSLSDLNAPDSYAMQVEGSGRPGFVKGTGQIRLSDGADGSTDIAYEGDVQVGGPVGAVAQRMLGGVAKRMVDQFFGCIEKQISESASGTAAS